MVFCDGLVHARSRGFEEQWSFTKDPVYCSSQWRKKGNLVMSAILTDEYLECDEVTVTLATVGYTTEQLLGGFRRVRKPTNMVARFCDSIRTDIEEMLESEE